MSPFLKSPAIRQNAIDESPYRAELASLHRRANNALMSPAVSKNIARPIGG
eukprot:gene39491-48798_t